MTQLQEKSCKPCEGGVEPLEKEQAIAALAHLDAWTLSKDALSLSKLYMFKNYHQAMAFVNALAWISHREDHHADVILTYNTCRVTYTTHAINGLSENDFICAAKVDALWKI